MSPLGALEGIEYFGALEEFGYYGALGALEEIGYFGEYYSVKIKIAVIA